MNRKTQTVVTTIAISAFFCGLGWAQGPPATILQVDIENWVQYIEDTSDPSKFATNPNATPAASVKNFASGVAIADIVAVNGQPVKGTMTRTSEYFFMNAAPVAGQAIADTARNAVTVDTFEILKIDGTPIGTITITGLAPGAPAPGAPLAVTQGNFAITGGTGAFLGVRGQNGQAVSASTVPIRSASITEDPANRRKNSGGKARWVMHLLPAERPEVMITSKGTAVTHSSDFTPVTGSKPAAAGEVLSLFMTGLGPTKPGVDPGNPFPANPVAVVNSPIAVSVNGESAEVLGAVGYPGAVDGYQLNFRMPSDVRGTATIQVSAAWISGSPVQIPVQ